MLLYIENEIKDMEIVTKQIKETKTLIKSLRDMRDHNGIVKMGDLELPYDTGRLARALLVKELISKLSNLTQRYAELCRQSKVKDLNDKDINKSIIDYYA